MAWQLPISTSGAGTAAALGTTDDLYVGPTVTLASTGSNTVRGTGSNHEVLIDGTILGAADSTVWLGDDASADRGASVTVNAGGLVRGFGSGAAVALWGQESTVNNQGQLLGVSYGVYLNGVGAGTSDVVNGGSIVASNGTAISATVAAEAIAIRNSGLVQGSNYAVIASGLDDVVTNTGRMVGKIALDNGDDIFMTASGRVTGTIDGGGGADKITGSAIADVVLGGAGNDTIKGLAGNDRITGGLGHDLLYGGLGADQFIFAAKAESTAGSVGRDSVLDFKHAQHDHLNLSAIDADAIRSGNQRFDFIGSDAFSGDAGELRYVRVGSNTYVYGDTDGNRVADFAIHLKGVPSLVAADFVL